MPKQPVPPKEPLSESQVKEKVRLEKMLSQTESYMKEFLEDILKKDLSPIQKEKLMKEVLKLKKIAKRLKKELEPLKDE